LENWQRALAAEAVVKPRHVEGQGALAMLPEGGESAFVCGDTLCLARTAGGAVVAQAADMAAARAMCAQAAVIVLDDATVRDLCGHGGPVVVTTRDLARRGSAAVDFMRRV